MAAGTRVSGMKRHFIIAEATPILCQAGQGFEERRGGLVVQINSAPQALS